MPEMSKAVIPPNKGDKHPRERILKLGQKITDVAAHKIKGITSDDPEYWGLASIVTNEMADVALKMKVRHHYTFAEMVKMNDVKKEDEERFQKLLDEMSYIGLLEYDYGNHYDHNGRTAPQSERRYCLPLFVPGSAELFNMEEGPEGNKRLKEHSGGEGHPDGKPVRRFGTHFLLAEEVRGTYRRRPVFVPCQSRGAWRGLW